ncbi:hypothetical protein KCH_69840 [Kitasatospora cheerisanensis KCTC 2395]|uniref:Uncharacterized protein n=1 Tax=Kitasatospora cheerisanensis KCTC 2395 TaxID=1348663 RepID=A0A066YJK8_9ACTN|nr:hypothetical protein KCH_69840 [Kitasatospora cheerisanensis KCTC 2395]
MAGGTANCRTRGQKQVRVSSSVGEVWCISTHFGRTGPPIHE